MNSDIRPKIGVLSVYLHRAEGKVETVTVATFSEANKTLRQWSDTAPKNGGYDKCDFKVIFEDGQEYSGRYDLKHWSCDQDHGPTISLQDHIKSFCEFMAGYKRPAWMSDKEWEMSLANNSNYQNDFRLFLDTYLV